MFSIEPISGSGLAFGQYYKICIDLDGFNQALSVGTSYVKVFVSALTKTTPRAILQGTNQML